MNQLVQRIDVYGMLPLASGSSTNRAQNFNHFHQTISLNPRMKSLLGNLLAAFLSVLGVALRLMRLPKFSK